LYIKAFFAQEGLCIYSRCRRREVYFTDCGLRKRHKFITRYYTENNISSRNWMAS